MNESANWLAELRGIHDRAFDFDWQAYLESLNDSLGLPDAQRLKTSVPEAPPMWFNGDVEALQPRGWTLVLSLNHQVGKYETVTVTRDSLWELSRRHNGTYPLYRRFFDPLIEIASIGLGQQVGNASTYATESMVFIETFPYASQKFSLPWKTQLQLALADPGYRTAREIEGILVDAARPGLVLVNGNNALWMFEEANRERLVEWRECRYPSSTRPSRTLHHWEGWLRTSNGLTPVVAFPFLRAIFSHNSSEEVRQLAQHARALVVRTPDTETSAT